MSHSCCQAPPYQLTLKDRALASAAEGITISDLRLPDNPLIYVNRGFSELMGYSREESIGRNCRYLQGPDTDPEVVAEIRRAIAETRPCVVELLNYRRDGSTFWNRLSLTPLRDKSGEFNAYQTESAGIPIGFLPEARYETKVLRLEPGDRLYLFSDGLPELHNEQGDFFDDARIVTAVEARRSQTLEQSVQSIVAEARRWQGDPPLGDDLTLLGLQLS